MLWPRQGRDHGDCDYTASVKPITLHLVILCKGLESPPAALPATRNPAYFLTQISNGSAPLKNLIGAQLSTVANKPIRLDAP